MRYFVFFVLELLFLTPLGFGSLQGMGNTANNQTSNSGSGSGTKASTSTTTTVTGVSPIKGMGTTTATTGFSTNTTNNQTSNSGSGSGTPSGETHVATFVILLLGSFAFQAIV